MGGFLDCKGAAPPGGMARHCAERSSETPRGPAAGRVSHPAACCGLKDLSLSIARIWRQVQGEQQRAISACTALVTGRRALELVPFVDPTDARSKQGVDRADSPRRRPPQDNLVLGRGQVLGLNMSDRPHLRFARQWKVF